MALKISDGGIALIKKFEGCRLTAYQDAVGVWTIGYGHTSGVKRGQTITQAQADSYLRADCGTAEKAVNGYDSKYHWNQNQFDALVSFTFNCGSGNLKKLTDSGKRTAAEISAKLPLYCNAGGKKLAGLVTRRNAEKALFDTPVATSTATASEATASGTVEYAVGKTYTTQVELNVRKGPGTGYEKVGRSGLSANAKANDKDKDGAIDKGTKVTCKDVTADGSDIWMKIPSGWIAAYYKGNVYVK